MPAYQVVMTAPHLAARATALLEASGAVLHYTAPYPEAGAVAALVARVSADAILARQGVIDAAVMDASPRLRIIARHGVGVDNVDLDAAAARGLLVTRAPGSNTAAVAEHTLALILAWAKGLRPLGIAVADGGWRGVGMVRDVAGLRLGLVGFGAVGREVARLAQAFGMAVMAHDPAMAGTAAGPSAGLAAALPDLLAWAQVVSLHCPLLPATHHLIDAAALALMPAGGLVVNTARGGIVDEAALLAALRSGHLSGAALDVFEREPPPSDHPLRRHPRVMVTPHVAGVTPDALDRMGLMAAECIVACLSGQPIGPERIVAGWNMAGRNVAGGKRLL